MISELILTVVAGLNCASNAPSANNTSNELTLITTVLESNNLDSEGYFELNF